ncbi:YbaN family protein [uncultured Ilyobacter sp.]|uniref:YbaN family protein n=1 Tax=uncultured Ilyobacter sp. TaxID=544433 RepID=UPI0029C6157F|nr:YbaN family protein [uncultured Ilyobacter sp.]
MKKYLLIIGGFISLFLGILGIILPLLPTTPFLLLSAGCFMKSSKKIYTWIINHKVFGSYIENYIKFRAISLKSKAISIVFLWCTILSSAFFFVSNFKTRILLIFIATAVTSHIFMIKTLTKEMILEKENCEENKN